MSRGLEDDAVIDRIVAKLNFAERLFHVRSSLTEVTRLYRIKEEDDRVAAAMIGSSGAGTTSSREGVAFLRGSMNNLRSLGSSTRNLMKKQNSAMERSDSPGVSSPADQPHSKPGPAPVKQSSVKLSSPASMRSSSPHQFLPRRFSQGNE